MELHFSSLFNTKICSLPFYYNLSHYEQSIHIIIKLYSNYFKQQGPWVKAQSSQSHRVGVTFFFRIRRNFAWTNVTSGFLCHQIAIGLFQKTKIQLSAIWQRIRFVVVFRLHGKGHKKFKCL